MQRQLESTERVYNTAYGLTPASVGTSRQGNVPCRGGDISVLFGTNRPSYATPAQNMRAMQEATEKLVHLEGKALQQQHVRDLIATANRLQEHYELDPSGSEPPRLADNLQQNGHPKNTY